MARKKKAEAPENHERWLVSYADFITLLFATFTALFAISSADLEKLSQMRESIQEAFSFHSSAPSPPHVSISGGGDKNGALVISILPNAGGPGQVAASHKSQTPGESPLFDQSLFKGNKNEDGGEGAPAEATPTPASDPTPTPAPDVRVGTEGSNDPGLATELREMFQTAGLDKAVNVRQETRGTVISLGEAAFFATGAVDVLPQSIHKLDKIMNVLRTHHFRIRIEGHTDNTPVNTGHWRDNLELSVMRAARICRFMVENYGFDPKLVGPAGYGEWHPIADNSTPAGRQKNRRVNIVILNDESSRYEPQ